ncbi:MAG: hypothetical protein NTY35_14060 [Planctomycetota bacterium]|nr:hypothetical protein [Planctomycetota bacterium]
MSTFLVLVLGLAPALQESVGDWFPRLEAESWTERELAQRRLAAALAPGDVDRLRAAIVAGGPETRLRLAHVLGDEDRLFGTAADLAVDADDVVARTGLTALRLAIERFEPYAYSVPIPREYLWSALAEHDGALIDARAVPRYAPAEVADLLALAQPASPRIVFDIPGSTSPLARRPVEVGAWRELARNAAQQAGGRLVGFGLRREPSPYAVRWLAVVAQETDEKDLRAGTLVERWCLDFARPGGFAVRAQAARALCAHGIPTAVAWIARRFREQRDDAALDGLLLAARRGNADAVLQEPFARARLWDELERAAHEEGPRGLETAIALGAVGAPGGDGAAAELARALADLTPEDAPRAELALVVLEAWAGPRAPAGMESAVRGLLARAELAPGLRFQALRVAARLGIVEAPASDAAALLRSVHASGHLAELTRLLRGAPGWPPAAWAEDGADPALETVLRAPDVRLALVDGWLAGGGIEPAARVLARLVSSSPRATESLRPLAGSQPRLRAAIERAASLRGLAAEETQTWLVACCVATEKERLARLADLAARMPVSELEWLALAELCAGATGEGARTRLVSNLATPTPDIALLAAVRAVLAIRADLDDAAERAFLQAVRGAVRVERGSPLDRAFRADAWPPPPTATPRALRTLDRDPARGPR